MSFLPDKYEIPEGSRKYMRLEEGKTKLRIVSSAIVGWEWWTDTPEGGRKPVRVKSKEEVKQDDAKHFWAFVVWNYETESFQIMEVTQKTIMHSVNALVADEAWGNPNEYDIVITRKGKALDTEYTVMPNPKKEFKEDTAELANINLEALYENEDPFASENVEPIEVLDGTV